MTHTATHTTPDAADLFSYVTSCLDDAELVTSKKDSFTIPAWRFAATNPDEVAASVGHLSQYPTPQLLDIALERAYLLNNTASDYNCSRARLLSYIKPGSQIAARVLSTSRSNMSYRIGVWVAVPRDESDIIDIINISNDVECLLHGGKYPSNNNSGSVKGSGYGTDRVFDIGYSLGLALFRDGYSVTAKHI